jgi:uncharacterized protein
MKIGLLTLHIYLTECASLKQKRGMIKPVLARLHKEFNISAAEVGLNDLWHEAIIGCALMCNDCAFAHKALQNVLDFFQSQWPQHQIITHRIECI